MRLLWKIALLVVLLVCVLFPTQLFSRALVWAMQRQWGEKFECASKEWNRGVLTMEAGHFSKECDEVRFDKLVWKPHISLWKRALGGKLLIEGLEVEKVSCRHLSRVRKSASRFIRFDGDLEVFGAHLVLANIGVVCDIERQEGELTLKTDFSGHTLSDLYALAGQVCGESFPEHLVDWEVVGGELKGEVSIGFVKKRLSKLKGQVDATTIEAQNSALELCGEWEQLHADFDLDFSSSMKVDTWDGSFALIGGRLALLGECSELWQGLWQFSDLHSLVSVKNGQVESSFLRGKVLGMEGEIDLDWQSRETLMELAFSGNSQEMVSLFPEGFAEAFPDDRFAVDASVKRVPGGLKLEGVLEVEGGYDLNFGCHFGDAPGDGPIPTMALPGDAFVGNLKDQFCLSGKRLGWFRGEGFLLEKFFAPFVGARDVVQIEGKANFEGTFDERYLVLFYEGENFSIEGNAFSLEIDRVAEEISSNIVATHYIDLKTGDHMGILPIRQARYCQKRRDIAFEPVCGMARIENNRIAIEEIEFVWSDLEMHGRADLTLDGFEDVDVKLNVSQIEGPLEDAVDLTRQFIAIPWEAPIMGDFSARDQGFTFHYTGSHFEDLRFSGSCIASTELEALKLEESHFLFDYDMKREAIVFSDAQGHVVYREKEYPFVVEKLAFQPKLWELAMPELTAKLENGNLEAKGELVDLVGIWEEGSLFIPRYRVGKWEGSVNLQGSELQSFTLDSGANHLALSGHFNGLNFEGEIEEVIFDLATLFPHKMAPWQPTGTLEGCGRITYDGELAGVCRASFRDLHFGGIHFAGGEDLRCRFSSSTGISIEGLEASVATAAYKLGGFHYDFWQEKLHFDGFDFAIPADRLDEVVEIAMALFPGKIHASLVEHLVALKQNEELAGSLSIELFPHTMWVALQLRDGTYSLFDQQFDLRHFSLVYDPLELKVRTEARLLDDYYWLHFVTDSAKLDQGTLSLSEERTTGSMRFDWESGWKLTNVTGAVGGCAAHLKSVDELRFEGQLTLDADRLQPLIKVPSVTGSYTFDGLWQFSPGDWKHPHFVGEVEAKGCGAHNVKCNHLRSQLDYRGDRLALRDLRVIDWSGTLSADAIEFTKEAKRWKVTLGELSVENFRLSRLDSPWTAMEKRERPLFRSFCIPTLSLRDFSGVFGRPETFTGEGELKFTNYTKRTLFSNLMQLPAEISARLGLDLTNFIPVRGQVLYSIEGERVLVHELRDVYSDGKRARFYLAGEEPASIDFAGNLDVKIRMKQYTLLMKLADLFTVSVKGTLFNPLYVFTNQE